MLERTTMDYLIKAIAFDKKIRAFVAVTTATIEEARKRHQTSATASAALGRTMTSGVLFAGMLKGHERYSIRVEGNGPLGNILVDAYADGRVRGYVAHPYVDFPLNEKGKLDVKRAVGTEGLIVVVRDLGLKQAFSGQVPIISGEIGEDMANYLLNSEQIPSSVGVGVLVAPDLSIQASGGFMIQAMPGCPDDVLTHLEKHLPNVKNISTLVDEGFTPEEIVQSLLMTDDVEIVQQIPIQFACTCSKERTNQLLLKLGIEELESMLNEDGKAEVQCEFCKSKYVYSGEELQHMILTLK
jgi:molecular chaperone Hsp33